MKEDNSLENIKEIFTNFLVENKQRKTPERFHILEVIYGSEGHFDADSLYNQMKSNYRVSLATVYNTLELLTKCNLVIKHQFGDNIAQYEKTFGMGIHHHLVCTNCGKIKEFSDRNIKKAIQNKKFTNFEPSHYTLYIYGLCKKCKDNEKKNKNL